VSKATKIFGDQAEIRKTHFSSTRLERNQYFSVLGDAIHVLRNNCLSLCKVELFLIISDSIEIVLCGTQICIVVFTGVRPYSNLEVSILHSPVTFIADPYQYFPINF